MRTLLEQMLSTVIVLDYINMFYSNSIRYNVKCLLC